MARGPEGARSAEEGGMALCLPWSSPARCCPHVWVQLFEVPEDTTARPVPGSVGDAELGGAERPFWGGGAELSPAH